MKIPDAMASAMRHLGVRPDYASVSSPRLLQYNTSSDVPEWDSQRDYDGNGIALTNNTFPRNKYAVGIQTNGMDGGGYCIPSDPTQPYTGCLMLANSSGTLVQAQVAREVWTFRISYQDPTNSSAAEVNIGFVGGFSSGNNGDWSVEWVRRTTGGHSCFTFYPCDYYGLNLDYLIGTASWSVPDCTMKLGPGYHAYIYYQASPYDEGAVPQGAQEWYPATTAATATRLAQPGGIIFQKTYSLGRADNALSLGGQGVVNPGVPGTGYSTVAPSIAAGSEQITVRAYDCGVLPNVAFNIERALQGGGGHAHGTPPSMDDVSYLDAYSGTTDSNGNWTTALHAGTISSAMQYTAKSQNVEGSPFTAEPLFVTTGFVGLIDPGAGIPEIRYTGVLPAHPSNHNGSTELHLMVRDIATNYNADADPDDQGSFGLNDMSLPLGGLFDWQATWAPPHSRHRFGTDCDIDRRLLRPDGSTVFIDVQDLKTEVQLLGGILIVESGGRLHVQVPEYEVGTILARETR